MRLTKQTGHSIRILIDCARAGGQLVKTAEIARRLEITPQNVFKIVHLLAHAGFVSAVRGPHGGVRLARPATDIRVGEVVRAMEVTAVEVEGGKRPGRAGAATPSVSINRVLDEALEAFIGVLDQHTLAEMAVGSGIDTRGAANEAAASGEPLALPPSHATDRRRGDRSPDAPRLRRGDAGR